MTEIIGEGDGGKVGRGDEKRESEEGRGRDKVKKVKKDDDKGFDIDIWIRGREEWLKRNQIGERNDQ